MKLFPIHTTATRLLTGFGLALWLFLSALPACRKEPNKTVIQGRITEYGTNTPIQGARIYLWCYSGEIFGPTGSSFVDSLVTDVNGAFHAEFLDKDLCGGIYLSAFKEGYFYKNDLDIHSGVHDLEIVLDPEAWLRLITIPDIGMWQSLGFGGSFSPHAVFTSERTEEQIFATSGGRKIVLHWGPFSSPTVIYSDSIYITPHDTTIYVIHY